MLPVAAGRLIAILSLLTSTLAVQVPLRTANGPGALQQAEPGRYGLDDGYWSLDRPPNPNATDHLVFETVYSLLQHWPNTRMRNGHNIVPGSIPKGTLLYHGTRRNKIPSDPDWVATDPEHSSIFCWKDPLITQEDCWHLTLITIRPLKIVYFDGSSAAKVPFGALDTQDLIAWGNMGDHDIIDEQSRIRALCAWGEKFGVDGFVRMEMSFEVMLCDFTAGVNVVSFLNLLKSRPIPYEVMTAGSWHNHFPGETRIKLDLSGLISFYDTRLAPSLIDIRAGQERWDHRVRNISSKDFATVKSRLEETLMRQESQSSGIDWRTLLQVIVDRFAGRLELTRHLLNSPVTDPDEILDVANKTQTQLRVMLGPYLLAVALPTSQSSERDLDWATPIYKLCAITHTSSMDSELDSMTDSEKLFLQAIRGTTREICRVITKMWAAGIHAGFDLHSGTPDFPDTAAITHVWNTWAADLNDLMAWLDWSVWIKCNPSCGPQEMCYLPTWPVGFPWWKRRSPPSGSNPQPPGESSKPDLRALAIERLAEEMWHIVKPELDDWVRPQPRCIRRVEPYDL